MFGKCKAFGLNLAVIKYQDQYFLKAAGYTVVSNHMFMFFFHSPALFA